jgi:PIN domain nuclease of toxin-antitoxin system
VIADTHTAVWYLLDPSLLSSNALNALDGAVQAGDSIYVASISVVEVLYLVEKGRIPQAALQRLQEFLADVTGALELALLDLGVALAMQSIPRDTVPDMPDRIIKAGYCLQEPAALTEDARLGGGGKQRDAEGGAGAGGTEA